jgi:hypothetical protein
MPTKPTSWLPAVNARDGAGLAWDQIAFDSDVFPPGGARLAPNAHGKVEVTDGKVINKIKKHETRGRHGHRAVDTGSKAATFKIKLTVWDDEGFDFIQRWSIRFNSKKNLKERAPIRVEYPSLRQMGVDQMVVEEFTALQPTGVQGMMSMTLSCVEHTPETQRKKNVTHVVATIAPGVVDAFGGGVVNRVDTPTADVVNFTPNNAP